MAATKPAAKFALAGARRQLLVVGVAMGEAEHGDGGGAAPSARALRLKATREAEGDDGGGDHALHARQRRTAEAGREAGDHEADEGGGPQPPVALEHEAGPEADADHGQHVIAGPSSGG